jgi:hypothetical protein
MTLVDIYNFFLNYQIPSGFAAMLRIAWPAFAMFCFTTILRDAIYFTHPTKGIYNGDWYAKFNESWYPQYSILNWFPRSVVGYWAVIALFYITGITSMLGLFTNLSLLVFCICAVSLLTRVTPLCSCGADAVHRMLYFAIIFIDCGSQYSLDNLIGIATNQPYVDGWTIRLLQIYLCAIYMCSSFSKLPDTYWKNGEVMRNSVYSLGWGKRYPIFLKLFKIPFVYKSLAWFVLLFEWLSFPIYFIQELRPFAVFFGVCFHLGIVVMLRIGAFGPVMIMLNLVFLDFLFKS